MKSDSNRHSKNKNRKSQIIKKGKTESEILHKKAMNLARGLKWGKGGTARAEKMLTDAIGTHCHWCGNKLTLYNISIDHKKPLIRPTTYTPRQLAILNSPKNLRVICRNCNFIKNKIPESLFQKLMDFLNTDRKLKQIIINALYLNNSRYSGYIMIEPEYNFKTGFLTRPKKK